MDNGQVSAVLEEIGTLKELQGDNPFKTRAFHSAARTIKGLGMPVAELVAAGTLSELRGVGRGLNEVITEAVQDGRSSVLDALRASLPPGLPDVLRVPGLGPRKVRVLWQQLGISSLAELEYACVQNRLVDLPGFGPKSQAKALEGLRFVRTTVGRFLLRDAEPVAQEVARALGAVPGVHASAVGGSVRRRRETVKDVDVVVAADGDAATAVSDALCALAGVEDVIAQGPTKTSVRLEGGLGCDLRVVPKESFATALHHFTGSREHHEVLRGRARSLGLKINEYGVFRGDEQLVVATEGDLYAALGLDYVPPELREATGEVEVAEQGQLPTLVNEDDVQGVLHVHTTWSDGAGTLEAMVQAAVDLGYRYVGISDHSKAAAYAGGLDEERLARQGEEIDRLNAARDDVVVFKGLEVDILADGSLDLLDEALDALDFTVASVHSGFTMGREQMTARVVRALEHPATTMLGHPTGRLLLGRDAFALDLDRVLEAAAEQGVVMEINAHPRRLDLAWDAVKRGRALGLRYAINPDAHSVAGLADVAHGVSVARRGWLTADDVLNCAGPEEVRAALVARRVR